MRRALAKGEREAGGVGVRWSRVRGAGCADDVTRNATRRLRGGPAHQSGEDTICTEGGAMRVVVILAHRQQRNVEADDDARGEVAGGFPEQHIRREFPQRRIAHQAAGPQAADCRQHRAHGTWTVLTSLCPARTTPSAVTLSHWVALHTRYSFATVENVGGGGRGNGAHTGGPAGAGLAAMGFVFALALLLLRERPGRMDQ